jgi:spermidine/putrescine transport system substrate-binding protein
MAAQPMDPRTAAIARSQVTRRAVLAGAGGVGLAAALAACGTGGDDTAGSTAPSPAVDRSDTEKTVRWANWTLYLDYDEDSKKYPTLEAFKKQSGLNATYSEDIDDNDTYSGKIEQQVRAGKDFGKDIIVFTDWMANRYVRQGWVQRLDRAAMPNTQNLRPQLEDVDWDPGRNNSMTWQSGFGVIAWNKDAVPQGMRNVSDLWAPELKGRVEVLSEMRDTMGLIMLGEGIDISGDFSDDDFSSGIDILQKQIDSGQIRQVKGNSYKDDLVSGDALAVIGWSGDIFQLNAEEGDKWEYRLPEAGGTYWSDNLLVPIGSPHLSNAEKLIDYYYDPKVAAEVAAYVNYVCPVIGAQAEMEKLDPDLAESPWIFPTDDFLQDAKIFKSLTPDQEIEYGNQFQTVIGN